MKNVDKVYIYFPGFVGVFRQCQICNEWRSLKSFRQGRTRVCYQCSLPVPGRTFGSRALALTEAGKQLLQDEQSS